MAVRNQLKGRVEYVARRLGWSESTLQKKIKGDEKHVFSVRDLQLVQHVLGVDFRGALDWLCGPAEGLSEAERAERKKKADENSRRQEAKAQQLRENSISAARKIWFAARSAEATPVRGRSCSA